MQEGILLGMDYIFVKLGVKSVKVYEKSENVVKKGYTRKYMSI